MKKIYQLFRFFVAGMLLLSSFTLQAQTVSRSGNGFVLNGGTYKFIGTNMRELAYQSNSAITTYLTDAYNAGNKVIRIYISKSDTDKFGAASKLGNLLTLASQVSSELRFIVVLTDFYQVSGHYVPGDQAYFQNGLLKNASWYDYAYQYNYLPYIQHIVQSYSNDSRIFAWELGNEIASENTNKAYMLNFAYSVGTWIQNNSSQMVTTGFINTSHATWSGSFSSDTAYKMYVSYNGQSSPFDFAVLHYYDEDFGNPAHDDELDYLRYTVGKPFIIEEVGFNGGLKDQNATTCGGMNIFRGKYWNYGGVTIADGKANRGPAMTTVVNKFFDFGADGAMSWAYAPYTYAVPYGDNCRGVDRYNHNDTDFNAIKNYLSGKAATLPNGGSGTTLTNVARSASLYYQTSQYSNDFSGAKAFDGFTSTKWTSDGAGANSYIILNLGRSYNVQKFTVKHASTGGEWTSMNTERFSLRYWNGSAWVDAVYNYYNSGQQGTTNHTVNINAQYVMLNVLDPNFAGDNYSRIPEFEVYAPSGSREEVVTTTAPPVTFNTAEVLAAFPNPVDKGGVTFSIQTATEGAAVLHITNLQGQVVKSYQANLTEGLNTLTVDISGLQRGLYIYNLEGQGMSQAHKLIIK